MGIVGLIRVVEHGCLFSFLVRTQCVFRAGAAEVRSVLFFPAIYAAVCGNLQIHIWSPKATIFCSRLLFCLRVADTHIDDYRPNFHEFAGLPPEFETLPTGQKQTDSDNYE